MQNSRKIKVAGGRLGRSIFAEQKDCPAPKLLDSLESYFIKIARDVYSARTKGKYDGRFTIIQITVETLRNLTGTCLSGTNR
jgi:hypothetical protein